MNLLSTTTPTLEPMLYFLTNSLGVMASAAAIFFVLGLWFGWLTWARHKRRARAFQEEITLLRHEIASLKRRIAEDAVEPPPSVPIGDDALALSDQTKYWSVAALQGKDKAKEPAQAPAAHPAEPMIVEAKKAEPAPEEPPREGLAAAVLQHHPTHPLAPAALPEEVTAITHDSAPPAASASTTVGPPPEATAGVSSSTSTDSAATTSYQVAALPPPPPVEEKKPELEVPRREAAPTTTTPPPPATPDPVPEPPARSSAEPPTIPIIAPASVSVSSSAQASPPPLPPAPMPVAASAPPVPLAPAAPTAASTPASAPVSVPAADSKGVTTASPPPSRSTTTVVLPSPSRETTTIKLGNTSRTATGPIQLPMLPELDFGDRSAAAAGARKAEDNIAATAFAHDLTSGLVRQDPQLGILYGTRPDRWDDLTLLRGVADTLQERLHECGIYTFKQIATWSETNVREVAQRIHAKDRIQRDFWVQQARELHYLKYGEKLAE